MQSYAAFFLHVIRKNNILNSNKNTIYRIVYNAEGPSIFIDILMIFAIAVQDTSQ